MRKNREVRGNTLVTMWICLMLFCVSASAGDMSLGNRTQQSAQVWVATSAKEYWDGMYRTFRYHDSIGDLDSFLVETCIGVNEGRDAYTAIGMYHRLSAYDSVGSLDSFLVESGIGADYREFYSEMRIADSTGDWRMRIAQVKVINDMFNRPRDEERGAAGMKISEALLVVNGMSDSLEIIKDDLAELVQKGGLSDYEREDAGNMFWAVTSAALAAQNAKVFASGFLGDLYDEEHQYRFRLCEGLRLNADHLRRYNSGLKEYSTIAERAYLVVECQKASGFIVQVSDAIDRLLKDHCPNE